MKNKADTPMERLKKITLWQWGLITIFAGLMANVVGALQAGGGNSAAERGQALGRGVATLVFVAIGLILIIMHFVRRKR